jgi:uncharacterized protein YbjQ (UPF0145 family)
MSIRLLLSCAACALLLTSVAQARDTTLHLPVKEVLEDAEAKAKLGTDVALFFGKQATPPVAQSLGEGLTNKKTNAFGKPDETACKWAMLSALIQLIDRARELGADAVVEIKSDYKKVEFVSDSEYECHAGGVMAGVALKGRFVKLKK